MTWTAQILTLYPEMFPGPLAHSLAGRALKKGLWHIETLDIREYASDKHRSVDDTPAGGGPGMVMRADVLARAIDAARQSAHADWPLIYLTPRGRLFDQSRAKALAKGDGATLICGRFEGTDQRVLEAREVEEISLGDYVLSGGEPAAIAILDSVIRMLPGVVGDPEALIEESFEWGLLEHPQYTRPPEWEGRKIPEVLTSGDHRRIAAWRRKKAEELTRHRRPDLWARHVSESEEKEGQK
jgi:tRNA (guanine37-N1)-methyltransferase